MGESTSQYFAIWAMSWPVCAKSIGRYQAMTPNTSSENSAFIGCSSA